MRSGDKVSSKWDKIRGKWQAHVVQARADVAERKSELDAKAADTDANIALPYALDAIDFAAAAIEEAEYAALDPVYARIRAIALRLITRDANATSDKRAETGQRTPDDQCVHLPRTFIRSIASASATKRPTSCSNRIPFPPSSSRAQPTVSRIRTVQNAFASEECRSSAWPLAAGRRLQPTRGPGADA